VIPYALKDLLSKALFLLLLTLNMQLLAQPDTLVVYEYIHVTDTVWVEPGIAKIASKEEMCTEKLPSDIKSQLEFSSIGKSEHGTLQDQNEDQTKFFSKPLIGMYLGYSWFWLKPNQYGAVALTGANHVGIDLKFPFYNNRWAVSAGIHSRGKPLSLVASSKFYSNSNHDTIDFRVGSYYSFPLLLHCQRERWRFFGGYEFKRTVLDKDTDLLLPAYRWDEHGLTMGIEYLIRPQLAISGKIYAGNIFGPNRRLSTNLYSGFNNSISLKFYLVRNQIIKQ
jgi:hypothetical protein